ncbi:MAG TPA: hypothetical protein VE860_06530, partial [Chthoniobacterales bacterium]|nr:hypothetical protein [Chthoniobacterales bacterium]
PTVGGNGAVEQIAFPALHGNGRTFDHLVELTWRLLNDDDFYKQQLAGLDAIATGHLSFASCAELLSQHIPGLT